MEFAERCIESRCRYGCCIGNHCGKTLYECNELVILSCLVVTAFIVLIILVVLCWLVYKRVIANRRATVYEIERVKETLGKIPLKPKFVLPSEKEITHQEESISKTPPDTNVVRVSRKSCIVQPDVTPITPVEVFESNIPQPSPSFTRYYPEPSDLQEKYLDNVDIREFENPDYKPSIISIFRGTEENADLE